MKQTLILASRPLRGAGRTLALAILLAPAVAASAADPASRSLEGLLDRTGGTVAKFLNQFSQVKCTEQVLQLKLNKSGKAEYKEESTFDYLVLLQANGGDLTLVESRLAERAPRHKENLPMLVTNGFSTLLLVFHPSYQASFQFTPLSDELLDGKQYAKVGFRHIPGMRSTAVLLLRGREYPLDLAGEAWVERESGEVVKMSAELESSMDDVGLRALRSEVEYAPIHFLDVKEDYRLPISATIEVETPRQHWRNLHRFTDYQRFSTSVQSTISEHP
ncbi:MAG: hypothetical protein ACE145_06290 [Terriglobia bacterium]